MNLYFNVFDKDNVVQYKVGFLCCIFLNKFIAFFSKVSIMNCNVINTFEFFLEV